MINQSVDKLISYGIKTKLIEESDMNYVRNRLLAKLDLDSYEQTDAQCEDTTELSEILKDITDFAAEKGIVEIDSIVYRDIFDTEIRNGKGN